jgi:hypothetical protein
MAVDLPRSVGALSVDEELPPAFESGLDTRWGARGWVYDAAATC